MRVLRYYGLALLLVAGDQLSKALALHSLIPYQAVACFPGLNWLLAFNSGAAFGFLAQSGAWHAWFFLLFSLSMSGVLAVWLARLDGTRNRLEFVALSFILAGALGNVVDRLRLGQVVDFIDVYVSSYHWPVFNLADSAICVGGSLLVLEALVRRRNNQF